MKPYLRADLLSVLDGTPEQTTWDIPALRKGGEELFGSITPDMSGACMRLEYLHGMEMRIISPEASSPEASDASQALGKCTQNNSECTDASTSTSPQVSAVILSIHGGGYVAGMARYDDEKNAYMAVRLNADVVSPEYRLAPEHPFPAGIDDCLAALRWCARRAADQGVPLYVFGDSAGGGLAYFCALRYHNEMRARSAADSGGEASLAPISGIILLEPCLDPRTNTQSFYTYANGPVWTHRAGETAWAVTATSDQAQAEVVRMLEDPQLVAGLPKVMIVANPADPLRDEDIALAQHLADCGISAELHMYAGTFHGSLSVSGNPVWEELLMLIKRFISC